jgi:hypothetical protein
VTRPIFVSLFILLAQAGVPTQAATVLEETIEKTYTLDPGAKFSIQNRDGSIWVYGTDGNEMRVQAVKKAYTQEQLDRIKVDVSVSPGTVSIATTYPVQPKWGLADRSGTVEYLICLPWSCAITQLELGTGEILIEGMHGTEANVSLANGRLFAHNCFTDLRLRVGNGALDVANDWWEPHRFAVDAQIVNGNVRAAISDDFSFHTKASSENGHVVCDFLDQKQREPGGFPMVDVVVGGESDNELKLRAVNGNIKIAEAAP